MNPFDPNRSPHIFARVFSEYVRDLVVILAWATIGLSSLIAAYVAIRCVWVAAQTVFKAVGI